MASADEYAGWIVKNADKKGTPDFDTVAQAYEQAKSEEVTAAPKAPQSSFDSLPRLYKGAQSAVVDTAAGLGAGVGDVGLGLQKFLGKTINAVASPQRTISSLISGKKNGNVVGDWLVNDAEQGKKNLTSELAPHEARSPIATPGGRIGGNIIATLPVGGVFGQVATKAGLPALGTALRTGGFRTGLPAATTTAGKVGQMALRAGAGATVGGVSAGLASDQAGMGAVIGGMLPPVVAGVGKIARGAGRVINGPAVAPAVQQAVKSARDMGYVIPPSQAKPTLLNRTLEGFSGKLTTAQNASAMNQPVTNRLAQKAIGATELSEAGLHQVRAAANQAYDELGGVGKFVADDSFTKALDNAGASTAALQKNFPELVNNEVDTLISGLKSRGEFDAQPTIEAIKQFRASAAGNKASQDPAKKALGRTQNKIAGALEDLIDRNLQQTGQTALLNNYRSARQTLAKVYDVEKAMNKGSGNIDAAKLANALGKGRPLTGELRDIAAFASRFPKANQSVDKMGSLPQTSPLDWIPAGAISAGTGNPLMMASLLARPTARKAALSSPIQNRLAKPSGARQLPKISPELQGLLYRAAPVATAR